MKKFLAIFLTMILIPESICLARKDPGESRSTSSSLVKWRDKQNQERTTITNRRFLYEWIYEDKGEDYALVMLEELQGEFYSPSERLDSTVKIKAFRDGSTKQKWEFSTKGDNGEISYPFYKVTNYGCCGSLDIYSWFSLLNGRKQFTSNFDLIKIGESYFAYHDVSSAIFPDERKLIKDITGVIEFGAENNAHRKFLVRGNLSTEELPLTLIKEKGVTNMASPKGLIPTSFEALKSVYSYNSEFKQDWLKMPDSSIKMIWTHGSELVIPIEKDQPRFDCATYSSGVTFEILKPDNLK
jgi:hypothetical protein